MSTSLLPHPPLLWRILRTTALVWAAFHLALAMLRIAVPHPVAGLAIVGLCSAAVWLDLRRHNELLFFANLGVPPVYSAATALTAAAALEISFQVAARLLLASA